MGLRVQATRAHFYLYGEKYKKQKGVPHPVLRLRLQGQGLGSRDQGLGIRV